MTRWPAIPRPKEDYDADKEGRVYLPGGATQPGFAPTAANEVYTP